MNSNWILSKTFQSNERITFSFAQQVNISFDQISSLSNEDTNDALKISNIRWE